MNDEEEIEDQRKLQRIANFQARNAKNKMKPKKLNAMSDISQGLLNVFPIVRFFLLLVIYKYHYSLLYR